MRRLPLIVALTALLLHGGGARAQLISPGELARAHEELEGIANCTRCHEAGKQLTQALCLDCHTELKGRVQASRGYHGRIPEPDRACEKCHLDHQGRDYEMIEWPGKKKSAFPHAETGWRLEGGHSGLACEKCHEPRLIKDPAIAKLQRTKRKETMLGLHTACVSCHFDEHRGQEGDRCEKCHDVERWKPAPRFKHDETRYPLRGAHTGVECAKCHPTEVDAVTPPGAFPAPLRREVMKLKDIPHQRCVDCHADPHRGRFGSDCESCHTVQGWLQLSKRIQKDEFHEKTRFPLRGAHTAVACEACHGPLPGMPRRFKGLAFGRCSDCHYDAHLGQLTDAPAGGAARRATASPEDDCVRCHLVEGFLPVKFELEDHEKTRYPLAGGHLAAPCAGCHPKNEELLRAVDPRLLELIARRRRPKLFSTAVLRLATSGRCEDCHADEHDGQLAPRSGAAAESLDGRIAARGCEACHRVESFALLRFDHATDTSYPLVGAHARAACSGCHVPNAGGAIQYRGVDEACGTCHTDVHFGQLTGPGGQVGCEACHDTERFTPTRFDHQDPRFTRFRLDGKHLDVKCEVCHFEVDAGGGEKARRYRPLPGTCLGCHVDPHDGAMAKYERIAAAREEHPGAGAARPDGDPVETRCEQCHETAGWLRITFPHELTGFTLRGVHARTPCSSCHQAGIEADLDRDCAACHRDPHAGELGLRCQGCHDETTWKGAITADTHRRTNFPLEGGHAVIPCEECHVGARERTFSRAATPCLACHAGDLQRAALGSIDHNLASFGDDCQRCHLPTRFDRARFEDHEACFQILGGEHRGIACLDCHSTLTGATVTGACETRTAACSGCHQHACETSDRIHGEVPGYQCKDRKCWECHQTID